MELVIGGVAAVVATSLAFVGAVSSSLEGVYVSSLWPSYLTVDGSANSEISWLSHREARAEVTRMNPLNQWRLDLRGL